jgi:hypothetical protein
MIDSGIDPVVINDTTRVKAYQDEDSYTLDYIVGDELGVYFMRPYGNYSHHNQGDLTSELGYLIGKVDRHQEESALGKYLALAGMKYKFVSLQGYSQSDWAEAVIYTNEDYHLDSSAEALATWFRGDIYTVCLEKLETYTSPFGDKTIERWEVQDSIGCITLSDDYTLETVAKDHFTFAQVA